MRAYLLRRLLYVFPVLLGVNLLTFALFFIVNTPQDMARMQLGAKRVTAEQVEQWVAERGYDRPLFWNSQAQGMARLTDTIYYQKSLRLFVFDFGRSDNGDDISYQLATRAGPSLALAVPTFLLSLFFSLWGALVLVWLHGTRFDRLGSAACITAMSISSLFYIIAGQYVVSQLWHLAPISGYLPWPQAPRFLWLPIAVGTITGLGASIRWYRTIFLEEITREHVRAARARGLSENMILLRHVLRNGMIPILTGVVAVIPSLFLGSLLLESFFAIPGLGSYTLDAIQAQDFAVVRSMVFLGACLYILGLWLTDVAYTLVDPRVRLQ